MEEKIQQVKSNFNKIKDIRLNVAYCFTALETKLTKLKATTNDFIQFNKHNIFVFGLDSFQFQSKLIDYEYNDMQKFYLALNNRMYCEYYKLYKIILEYTEQVIGTNKNIEMLKSNNIFPIYKDLEPLKQYNFETIEEIHKTIVSLLNTLNEHILLKENQLQTFQLKQKIGLNINNFVNAFDFDVIVIKQKCILYLSYLDFFHNIHTKHFKRFSKKMKLMNDHLDEDINFDEAMHNKEDESIKSSASTSSLESTEDVNIHLEPESPSKTSMKTIFKNNVKKVINSLKLKNNITSLHSKQNMLMSFDEIDNNINNKNIGDMLDNLTQSFDNGDILPTPVVISLEKTLPINNVFTPNDVNPDIISETINDNKIDFIEEQTDTVNAVNEDGSESEAELDAELKAEGPIKDEPNKKKKKKKKKSN
jgi:hypothetical protein